MRGVLVGLAVFGLIVLVGFGALIALAESVSPEPEEMRVDLSDDF